jgi:cell pole-organizing protein PopZ
MKAMKQAGEPSVEEILESIKKVIARDSRDAAAAERAPRPARPTAPVDFDEDEVLDLAESATLADPEPLVADAAISSMRESLAALATMSAPGVAPQIVRSGETSLEGLVREMLRPMLADWLDKNLPPMVERLVAAEIARIVGKKG